MIRLLPLLLLACAPGAPDVAAPEIAPSFEGVPFTLPGSQTTGQVAPPMQDLTLTVTELVRGESVTMTITGGNPGERVHLLRGNTAGAGPCVPAGAPCLGITGPQLLATPLVNASGEASLTVTLPAGVPAGFPVFLQAAILRGPGLGDTSTSPVFEGEVGDPVVRFIAMGDGGEGNPDQYQNASAIETICAQRGCDFALYMGDNFYDGGVTSVTDSQFDTKFEQPYANLTFPFYVVTGNHDFGEVPLQFWRTQYQIDYTAYSTKWRMYDNFYTFSERHVDFFALDTNIVMLNLPWDEDPDDWMTDALAASTGTWRVAFGHHPYVSNGRHGNAGNYEGAWFDITGLVRGDNVEDFMQDHVCGQVDISTSAATTTTVSGCRPPAAPTSS
jgi:hypothetical protein